MKFAKIRDVKSPEYGTPGSAGIDFFVPNDFGIKALLPGCDMLIPSGIKVAIPTGYMLMGADKSGIATTDKACKAINRKPKSQAFPSPIIIGAKIIDEDYQGEIHIHLINVGKDTVYIRQGMKIAQFILVPVRYEALEETTEFLLHEGISERGEGSFGSTDK